MFGGLILFLVVWRWLLADSAREAEQARDRAAFEARLYKGLLKLFPLGVVTESVLQSTLLLDKAISDPTRQFTLVTKTFLEVREAVKIAAPMAMTFGPFPAAREHSFS